MKDRQDVIDWMLVLLDHHYLHTATDAQARGSIAVEPSELTQALRALVTEGFRVDQQVDRAVEKKGAGYDY
jgi:type III secretory pathway lipoprotein EscJ